MNPIELSTDRTSAALRGYARLRWLACAGHFAALGVTWALGFALDLPALAVVLGVELAAGLAVHVRRPAQGEHAEAWLVGLMLLDAVVLIALLYLTGGPHNPMSVVVMVNIAMAAIMLPPSRAWGVTAFALGLSALLFVDSRPLVMRAPPDVHAAAQPEHDEHGAQHVGGHQATADHAAHADHTAHGDHAAAAAPAPTAHDPAHEHDMSMDLHVRGMWAGYIVAGAVIVGFMLRLRRELAARDEALRRSRDVQARVAQRARLATLAAGAAHELATPLASIAVAADELTHQLEDADARADVAVIRDQVRRCRDILQRMALGAGEAGAGGMSEVAAVDIARAAIAIPGVVVDDASSGARVRVFGAGLTQALANVVDNAIRAASAVGAVRVTVGRDGGDVVFDVDDDGDGIPEDVLEHIGEPFYSTRPEGEGMGLGLFVARSVVEQLGGALVVGQSPMRGTRVSLRVPLVGTETA